MIRWFTNGLAAVAWLGRDLFRPLTWKLGWRNLWRNSRRSLLSAAAVATALIFLILLQGMMEGMKDQLLENGTALVSGHLQLHNPEYLPDRIIYDTVGGEDGLDVDLIHQLEQDLDIETASPRVFGFALLSTGEHSAGAQLMGIQPDSESRVTTFLNGVTKGQQLSATPQASLLLGEGLAKELQAEPGSEVAAVTQAADGSMGNALYRVDGIVRTGMAHLDRSMAVVHVQDLQELLALEENRFHEIAVRLTGPQLADEVAGRLTDSGNLPPQVLAQSWGDLAPQLRDYLGLFEGMYIFMIGFVGIFAALGILNTMMMAVFERTREIGTVISLGMFPSNIVATILAESFLLTVLGLVAGTAISALLMQPLTTSGLDLSRWMGELSMMDTRMDPVIRFIWVWPFIFQASIGLLFAGLVAAVLPAWRAARMNPVEARNSAGEV